MMAFANSLTIAFFATLISLVIGALAGVCCGAIRFPGKPAVEGASTLPIVVPEICMGVAMLLFFTRVLPWPNYLLWPFNLGSIIIAHVVVLLPLRRPRGRRAARKLQQGAGGGRHATSAPTTGRRSANILLPHIKPALIAARCLPSPCRSTIS